MTRRELQQLEEQISGELSHKSKYGGWDVNAPLFVQLIKWQLQIVQHLVEQASKKK